MRQIKFRGFNKKHNKWLYGYYLVNRGEHFICEDGIQPPSATWEDFLVDPETVGQFTGLKDRNDKGIYEGDVVKDREGRIDVITWDSLTFNLCIAYASSPNGMCANFFNSNPLDGLKVIGNIHDNPELLK